ncbi:MAG: fumarate hydratase C-terminal domain-containing protein [Alphaproteobacteria bacterium]|nr:fumarate hydratase C-terminal domain-containing protein [Alphaproteobacteria bacterium]
MSSDDLNQDGLKIVHLDLPAGAEQLAALEIGSIVYLTGTIFTGREGLYKRVVDEGQALPDSLIGAGGTNFHCSPAAAVDADGSYNIGAVTATASFRFSKWMDKWFELSGCNIIIGKGGMSGADYRNVFVPNGAVYLTTVGYGTGALLGRGIKQVREVHWLEELGIAQAVWVLEVENFGPLIVDGDLRGNSFFEQENAKINAGIGEMYKGLKEPSLRRYGETARRDDEVI